MGLESTIVARYFISAAVNKRKPLNMTKLQKLLFILYGYYLARHGERILEEQPRAWPFGPVFPNVHKHIDYTVVTPLEDPSFSEIHNNKELVETIDRIIDGYAGYSAKQLSNWSHMKGSPWERTTQQPGFKWSASIQDQYIKEYFSTKEVI